MVAHPRRTALWARFPSSKNQQESAGAEEVRQELADPPHTEPLQWRSPSEIPTNPTYVSHAKVSC